MIHLLIAFMFMLLAYLIKYKQWSWLISGYNTSSKKQKEKYDEEALCHGAGNLLFLLTGIAGVGAIGEFNNVSWIMTLSWGLFLIVILAGIIYMNTGNRFKK